MLISYWSTALIEAGLIGLPVYFVNLDALFGVALDSFSREGFCNIVRSKKELNKAIKKLCEAKGNAVSLNVIDREKRFQYLGFEDANNTTRVVDSIMRQLMSIPLSKKSDISQIFRPEPQLR
jgi:hypothetical protein